MDRRNFLLGIIALPTLQFQQLKIRSSKYLFRFKELDDGEYFTTYNEMPLRKLNETEYYDVMTAEIKIFYYMYCRRISKEEVREMVKRELDKFYAEQKR